MPKEHPGCVLRAVVVVAFIIILLYYSSFSPGRAQAIKYWKAFIVGIIMDLHEGLINDPLMARHHSIPFLPATLLSWSRALEEPFEGS